MHKCRLASIVIVSAFGLFIILGIISSIVAPNNDNPTSASNPPRPAATPTSTPTPIPWYTPIEITEVYQTNIARAHLMFESGIVHITSTVAELHPTNPRLIYLSERQAAGLLGGLYESDAEKAARDWRTIRAELPIEQVATLNVGDAIAVRCDKLEQDRYVSTGAELICHKATLVEP